MTKPTKRPAKRHAVEWTKGITKWSVGHTLFASIPFTWDLHAFLRQCETVDMFHSSVVIGGPAVKLAQHIQPDIFRDLPDWVTIGDKCDGALQRMNPQATRTTVGCIRKCSFCAVPITEGDFQELEDWPDLPVICDNNLLAASQAHFDKVCDRLEKHTWCDFNQGLDARLLTDYHAERIGRLRGAIVRLALDHSSTIAQWCNAWNTLRKYKVAKSRIRTYVLCGFKDNPHDAWARCEIAEHDGGMALPQWYHPLDATTYNACLQCHIDCGWDGKQRDNIMQYYYQHRGTKGV